MSAPSTGPRYVVVVDPPVEASFIVDMRPKDGGSPVAYLHISDINKCHEVAAALNAQEPQPAAPTATEPAVTRPTEEEFDGAVGDLISRVYEYAAAIGPEANARAQAAKMDATEMVLALFRRALAGGGK